MFSLPLKSPLKERAFENWSKGSYYFAKGGKVRWKFELMSVFDCYISEIPEYANVDLFFIWIPKTYPYIWMAQSILQMLLHMFFFLLSLSLFSERPGLYLWWASFSYNWIEALPTARQDLVKLKVLLDCCYLCADSVTAVTTAAACQGLSRRIPPLITVFIGN